MSVWNNKNIRMYCRREVVCHVVAALSRSETPLYAAQLPSGAVLIFCDEYSDRFDDYISSEHLFDDGRSAASWLKANGLAVPAAFKRALRANRLGDQQFWPAALDDILGLRCKTFRAWWSLSYETHDFGNHASFDTLEAAYSCLGEVGAMMAIPGNCGSISIGSVKLYSTHFESAGIDRGDSHVNPTMRSVRSDLFEQIRQFEEQRLTFRPGWRTDFANGRAEVF
ncbi:MULTISPECIES: hypothetical protein [Burkholderia]|uniref:hypothetical protein n=1 Tax=Burkholderia TaxID=32008 RepID=UPI0012EBD903|nr:MULTISPECIES: hypothetical protein [Burkholderia]